MNTNDLEFMEIEAENNFEIIQILCVHLNQSRL